ncbi:hypothetical protein C427_1286 [Paraglaciecola psychrophila 170]|uniref:Uncharacterized protein n=1 Tax=Paraglaciecola psychrophila 170 TaxID=1129794 RepID=K6Z0C4_9ALTE|nr:hypothetical protein C427_1286 [Paraglaciecola psychrophila 170]GAC38494.1 hypothetical protein GPSY_2883 [Paraglaciecola psychrophila 170]
MFLEPLGCELCPKRMQKVLSRLLLFSFKSMIYSEKLIDVIITYFSKD